MTPVIYWTDFFVFMIVAAIIYCIHRIRKNANLKGEFALVFARGRYWVALIIVTWFGLIGLLDSLHFQSEKNGTIQSLLDSILSPRSTEFELTYSAPFAIKSFTQEVVKNNTGQIQEIYPRLQYAGKHLENPNDKWKDIILRVVLGMSIGALIGLILYVVFRKSIVSMVPKTAQVSFWVSLTVMMMLTAVLLCNLFDYHVLGTNKVGQDVLYIALKSVRTGLIIGTVTTLFMLPFALSFGMWAGYYRGVLDDIIQYIYTTLSSIPAVLLIAAAILSFQARFEHSPELKLLVLCIILGVTSWTSLCRLLRAETLKLREAEFVQAAMTLGMKHSKIIRRHILPNLLHIVIITVVLDFSALVLAEAVLSFVGVGVDPSTYSFGNMINASRLEMAREPLVWWSLCGAFVLMFGLVFSANIVAEGVQEVFNPRKT